MVPATRLPRVVGRVLVYGTTACWLMLIAAPAGAAGGEPIPGKSNDRVNYGRDIAPLLGSHCYACHGPDQKSREADLRLDVREVAVQDAIVPGKADESPLVERIASDDDDLRMPPADSKKPRLTPEQVSLVRQWIDEGARYEVHWAYLPPKQPPLPEAADAAGSGSPIDRFVAAGYREHDVSPVGQSDRRTLIRRLSLDLTGLAPRAEEVDAFLADASPQAYEKLVDRLLASPHFGERMANYWLDVARYADTGGYHSDNHRNVWMYRDWVIEAFNKDKPYDQFVTEQLAGDLLPDATESQRVASGFNRLLETTEEGGAQPKEYTAKYAADRVRNTAEAFMAATMGCCECHDHKFDPYTTKDFYGFAAFFADVKENAVGRQDETKMPSPQQRAELAELDAKIAAVEKTLSTGTAGLAAAQSRWEKTVAGRDTGWTMLRPVEVKSDGGTTLAVLEDGSVRASGTNPDKDRYTATFQADLHGVTGLRLEVLPDDSLPAKGPGRAGNGNFVLNELTATVAGKPVAWSSVTATHAQNDFPVAAAADGELDTGWAILPKTGAASEAILEIQGDVGGSGTSKLVLMMTFDYGSGHAIGRWRLSATRAARPVRAGGGLPGEITSALAVEESKRNDKQRETLAAYYRSIAPELEPARRQLAELQKQRKAFEASIPTTLVSESLDTPRTVRILPRGNWQDDSGEVVAPAVPRFLGTLDAGGRRSTRLNLAQWMTRPDNPLVARVMVNRVWMLLFGRGLVKTTEDFGTQGELPTHPELLDWLAVDFTSGGWDVKRLVKQIVMSRTYRLSSDAGEALRQRDPDNRWLARQGQFRLDAEFIRDNALAAGGLLSEKIGGPSVKPYQPAGYWQHLNFPKRTWVADQGEEQYRRGMYTYWQRTFLHPSLLAFDAPSRETCTPRRARSNTPLQSLVLLNDPTYVEAARTLAAKIVRLGGSDESQRAGYAVRTVLGREAKPKELEILSGLYRKHRGELDREPEAAKELLAVGDAKPPEGVDPVELASWTSVARVILNLHETITRY